MCAAVRAVRLCACAGVHPAHTEGPGFITFRNTCVYRWVSCGGIIKKAFVRLAWKDPALPEALLKWKVFVSSSEGTKVTRCTVFPLI